MLLYYFVTFRLDVLAAGLLAVGGLLLATAYVRARSRSGVRIPVSVHLGVAALIFVGGVVAEDAARRKTEFLVSLFSGIGPTFANDLAKAGHASVTSQTAADDPTYLSLLQLERDWLRLNPLVADVYTVRLDSEGKVRFVVDSETDYNGDGVIAGERELRTPIGEEYPEATPQFYEALAGRSVFDSEFVPDRWGVFVCSLTPILGPDGKVEAAVGIDYPAGRWLSDIAIRRALVLSTTAMIVCLLLTSAALIALMRGEIRERTAAQTEAQRARDAADAASRAKGEFLAVMSHEIRTPLTAITGYASMLEQTHLDSTQLRYVRTMHRGATSLVEMLNNVLDFSRMEEGKLHLEPVPCQPSEVVRDVLELMTAAATEKGLYLRFEDELPALLLVEADPVRLKQIVTNLLGNAVKFTAVGGVTVRAVWTAVPHMPDAGTLEIKISDTGPGIPEEKQSRLFQRFTQISGTARRHGGSGLGLAISRQLIELMKGRISVSSTPGKGSQFCVAVPCHRIDPDTPLAPEPAPGTGRAEHLSNRLLVVDDNAVNCEVLKAMLARPGVEIDVANSGASAIAMAANTRYAAILMDVAMPDIDGLAATAAIRAAEKGTRTPIIAVTAATSQSDRQACLDAGMDDYIVKPVEYKVLLTVLKRFRDQQRGPEAT